MAEQIRKKFALSSGDDEVAEAKDVSFDLGNQTFRCVPRLPFVAGVELSRNVDDIGVLAAAMEFIETCLEEAEVKRFRKFVKRTPELTASTMMDVTNWLLEAYSDRPTQPPGESSNGRQTTGNTSSSSSSTPAGT